MAADSCIIRNPINSKEFSEIFQLLKISFPRLNPAYYKKRILEDSGYKRLNSYIVIKNNKIVSFVQLYDKKIWYQGRKLKFAGLGAVCTLPEFRQRGYSSALIESILRTTKYPIVGLFTRIPKYYKRFGFSVIPRERIVIKRSGWVNSCIAGGKIKKFSFKRDITEVERTYEFYFSEFIGGIIRKRKDWQSQLSYFDEDKKLFLVLEFGGRTIAYIRCKWHKNKRKRLEIVEFASKNKGLRYLAHFITYLFDNLDIKEVAGFNILFPQDVRKRYRLYKETDYLMMWRVDDKYHSLMKRNKKISFLEADSF